MSFGRKSQEQRARDDGYHHTGIYSRYHLEAINRADEERAKGYKARVVVVPDSPYSRGTIGRGWSVYVKETPKLAAKLEAEKKAKEEQYASDLKSAKTRLGLMTSSEIYDFVLGLIEAPSWLREKEAILKEKEKAFLSKMKEFKTP